MSVQDFSAPVAAPKLATIDTSAPGIPLSRLVKVELRKMFNTRSGFWLMASIVILAVAISLIVVVFNNKDATYGTYVGAVTFPMVVLLPIVAVLAVTSEWTQRTGLITFTVVPRRGRIIAAKGIASVLIGLIGMVAALAFAALGNLLGGALAGKDAVWDMTGRELAGGVVINMVFVLVGFMIALLVRNTPGAIVVFFVYVYVLPTILAVIGNAYQWFADLQPWIDIQHSTMLMVGEDGGSHVGQFLVSAVIWLLIPMGIGIWRVMEAEVK